MSRTRIRQRSTTMTGRVARSDLAAPAAGAAGGAALTYLFDPERDRRRRARLHVHQEPGDVSARQGEGQTRDRPRPELLQQHWAPGARVLAGAAGGALTGFGLARRGLAALAATVGGTLLLIRAATNLPLRRLTGVRAGREAMEIDKSITIDAPAERVWDVLEHYETFPSFMTHVRDVSLAPGGRSHWKVDGPLGTTLEWDAEEADRQPGELLAWRTSPGAAIRHAGHVRLERADGATRMHVHRSGRASPTDHR
ncbi:MAG TPA: SRPBCC family protein [Acidimicrobiales bacterium]